MAVAKTGAMFKSLTFDGYSSRNYGVYITGEAVYNAPERAVEMISIPNRNGAFALDEGHFENIEVTYPAGVFADNEADFADAISDFRNLLCSRKGYCTLTDEYHPDEYREAVYKSGLEVTPSQLRAGEFTITFECKPQRFLNSGEEETEIYYNGTITNPTLFDSQPLLKAYGYGAFKMNGYKIEINNVPMGHIVLKKTVDYGRIYYQSDLVNPGDSLLLAGAHNSIGVQTNKPILKVEEQSATLSITKTNADSTGIYGVEPKIRSSYLATISFSLSDMTFTVNTAGSILVTCDVKITFTDSTTQTVNYGLKVNYDTDGSAYCFAFQQKVGGTYSSTSYTAGELSAESTVSALGNPTYIDCETGLVYKIENDEYILIPNAVEMGADLPVLNPGINIIEWTAMNLGKVTITPRWWKI